MNNPLLQDFNTVFDSTPFDRIKNSHFLPAITKAIEEARENIESIIGCSEPPTFQNTLEKLEFSGEKLDRISSIFYNLNSADTNPEIQKIAQEISPLLAAFSNDVALNNDLFQKVKQVYDNRDVLDLTPEQKMLLDKKYKFFSRNGANLKQDDKQKLRDIDKKLSQLKLQFSENVLADTHEFELYITQEEDLIGIPKQAVETAHHTAKEKGKEGWVFTLDYPSYHAVVTYSEKRSLREKMTKAYAKRGFKNNTNNNESILLEIVNLRYKRAKLLGYTSHAAFVLEERMAKTPDKVLSFLDEIFNSAINKAKEQYRTLENFALKQGIDMLQSWDASFYSEKLKKQLFNLDDELLKPYFQLNKVLDGAFQVAHKLYDLNFEVLDAVDVYHEDVQVYKVTDNKKNFIALFYTDFFPRKGKRNGAWMTSYKNQWIKNAVNSRPHVSIVCNFTKPTQNTPSLLSFREVTTLFHEFGHALHGMLANTTYPSLSGTNVYWDFVELPSQILENWAYEPEALKLFASHYQTGKIIPIELVDRIKESSNFMEGLATLRQLSFGYLDMAWHNVNPEIIQDVKTYERDAFKKTQLYPEIDDTCMSTAFSHIFPGGYSSGYYSYKWAEVLDADAFEFFKENGIFNKEVAVSFKEHVLSKGGTEDPMIMYKRFRGKEPSPKALLKRAGLL